MSPRRVIIAFVAGAVACVALAAPAPAVEEEDNLGSSLPVAKRIDLAMEMVLDSAKLFDVYRIVHDIDPEAIPGLPYDARWGYAYVRTRVAYQLGLEEEARAGVEQLFGLYRETDNPTAEIYARYYRATLALTDPDRVDPGPQAIEDLRVVAERGEAIGKLPIACLARLNLGKLLPGDPGARELERALEIARKLPEGWFDFRVRCEIARRVARQDPAAADAMLRSALEDYTRATGDPWSIYGWQARLDVVWAARPRAEAVAYSLDLLDRIEMLRAEQGAGTGSMGFFSSWVEAYSRVGGLLLRDEAERTPEDVELAFELSEKTRGRVLLERLGRSGIASDGCGPPDPDGVARRAQLREEITARQRALQRSEPATAARLRREVEDLMLVEEAVRHDAPCDAAGPVAFVALGEIERMLGPDEALLVYQIGGWTDPYGSFDGGSWVFVVTSEGTRVLRLPDRQQLHVQRDAFLGAVGSRDGAESGAAVALHRSLLEEAERVLPRQVDHLIIVPHGPTDGIPFAALRSSASGPMVIDRYRVSYVPSATLWARWRTGRPPTRRGVLAVADPTLDGGWERLWPRRGDLDLRPLAGARDEAEALVHSLGEPGRILEGDAATEVAVKQADLQEIGFLLFAAHAVMDDRYPRRSAIILAPGSDDQDGLLQPPEIAELPLDGAIVVLSACQSASGRTVAGEGILSLARSFLQAGAAAVIGNLWPARDDEAAALFGSIYRELGSGKDLAESVRIAQRQLRDRGTPAEGWAGVILLGVGDARLRPERATDGLRAASRWPWLLLALPPLLWIFRRRFSRRA